MYRYGRTLADSPTVTFQRKRKPIRSLSLYRSSAPASIQRAIFGQEVEMFLRRYLEPVLGIGFLSGALKRSDFPIAHCFSVLNLHPWCTCKNAHVFVSPGFQFNYHTRQVAIILRQVLNNRHPTCSVKSQMFIGLRNRGVSETPKEQNTSFWN